MHSPELTAELRVVDSSARRQARYVVVSLLLNIYSILCGLFVYIYFMSFCLLNVFGDPYKMIQQQSSYVIWVLVQDNHKGLLYSYFFSSFGLAIQPSS